jgi:hypothetical protein
VWTVKIKPRNKLTQKDERASGIRDSDLWQQPWAPKCPHCLLVLAQLKRSDKWLEVEETLENSVVMDRQLWASQPTEWLGCQVSLWAFREMLLGILSIEWKVSLIFLTLFQEENSGPENKLVINYSDSPVYPCSVQSRSEADVDQKQSIKLIYHKLTFPLKNQYLPEGISLLSEQLCVSENGIRP